MLILCARRPPRGPPGRTPGHTSTARGSTQHTRHVAAPALGRCSRRRSVLLRGRRVNGGPCSVARDQDFARPWTRPPTHQGCAYQEERAGEPPAGSRNGVAVRSDGLVRLDRDTVCAVIDPGEVVAVVWDSEPKTSAGQFL